MITIFFYKIKSESEHIDNIKMLIKLSWQSNDSREMKYLQIRKYVRFKKFDAILYPNLFKFKAIVMGINLEDKYIISDKDYNKFENAIQELYD